MTYTNELKKEPRSGLSDLTVGLAADKLDAERYRYLKSCFKNKYQLIEFSRRLGCRDDEFMPTLDCAIDTAMAANVD